MFGFPAKYCRVVASRVEGDDAHVLLNTGSAEEPYLYGVNCQRQNGRWFERGSSNLGGGWEQTADDARLGALSMWGDAPAGADKVRADFEGRVLEAPVNDIAFPLVWRRVDAYSGFYNSNSFAHGLLHSAGVKHDERPFAILPGWRTPVPNDYFFFER